MTHWMMYLITRLDFIVGISVAVMIISLIATILLIVGYTDSEKEAEKRKLMRSSKISIAVLVLSTVTFCAVPSTKDFVAIYLIPKFVNNEEVQKLPDNAVKLLNVKMEEWIKDSLDSEDSGDKESKK